MEIGKSGLDQPVTSLVTAEFLLLIRGSKKPAAQPLCLFGDPWPKTVRFILKICLLGQIFIAEGMQAGVGEVCLLKIVNQPGFLSKAWGQA